MDDPCVRKSTNPSPVIAPQKLECSVGQIVEDLIVFNSESGGKIIINTEGDTIEEEHSKKAKQIASALPVDKDTIEETDEGTPEPPCKKQNTNKTLEQDLILSEEETEKAENSQKWKLVPLNSPKPKTLAKSLKIKNYPPNLKTKSKVYKSKEFIAISDSEEECGDGEIASTRNNNSSVKKLDEDVPRKKIKLIDPIASTGQKACIYIFKNHPKKGEKCGHLSREDLCPTHKKLSGSSHPVQIIRKLNEQLSDLKKSFDEKESEHKKVVNGLEKEIESLKVCIENMQTNLKEINIKIAKFSTNESSPSNNIKTTKITKLNKEMSYKLIKYLGEEGVFESPVGTFKMKIPANMGKPKSEDTPILKFNQEIHKFEWLEKGEK